MDHDEIELNRKYVFHIPLFKFAGEGLIPIGIDGLLDDLIGEFCKNGFENFYFVKAKSHYKSRCFDEILLVIFTDSDLPLEIFEKWFRGNNDALGQEAFAWECGNSLFIRDLM